MPYVAQEIRSELWERAPKTAGELNYILTGACQDYFSNNGANYQAINDVIGALEGCKLEFYRRLVAPYEDTKIEQNGDCY